MDGVAASKQKTLEEVKEMVALVRSTAEFDTKMAIYKDWAANYDQDVAVLGYDGPSHVLKSIMSHFHGERETAVVLDVACGTGLVAHKMKQGGFGHFVGIDGSEAMLEEARKKGLYQELKQCNLGQQLLPVQEGSCDVVVMCGALNVDHVSWTVVRELCSACKPGGVVCMTCRRSLDNLDYLVSLERELQQMEDDGLWRRVSVTEVEKWSKTVPVPGNDSGVVYLYQKV